MIAAPPELPSPALAAPDLPAAAGHDLLEVSMGPHHPSTHGVFRMNVVLDGETVVKLKPVFGYLHRNHEKIAEKNSYLAAIPYTDRLDYICSMTNNWAYVLSVEKLAGLPVPDRAQYIRVIVSELTRLFNHACLAGFLLQDMGAMGTPLMYAFREREKILDLFEWLTGSRMMCNYLRFGGCRCDLPPGWLEQAVTVTANFTPFLDHFEALLTENEIIHARSENVGVLPRDLAINAGVTGPGLRASGVNYDIRKVDHYGLYDRFNFLVPLGQRGDTYDRYMVRDPRNARVRQNPCPGPARHPRRPRHGPQGQAPQSPPQSRRGRLPARRIAQRRTRLLPHQRRRANALALPHPPSLSHQPDRPRRYVPWAYHRRCRRHPGQH